MKSVLVIAATVFFSLFSTREASASAFVDPYLGYAFSGSLDNGSSSPSTTGLIYGLRGGWEMLGLMIGAEYMGGSDTYKDPSTSQNTTLTPMNLGVHVGYKFPIMLRVFGTYFLDSNPGWSVGGASGNYKGSGYKLGVGYTGFPIVSVNLEYAHDTYNKITSGGTTSDLSPNVNLNLYMLTVSVPFVF